MKEQLLNARYGYKHKLIQLTDDSYRLELDPNGGDTYRIGYSEKGKIDFIDPPGGPFLQVGCVVNDLGRITNIIGDVLFFKK